MIKIKIDYYKITHGKFTLALNKREYTKLSNLFAFPISFRINI